MLNGSEKADGGVRVHVTRTAGREGQAGGAPSPRAPRSRFWPARV
jgi:hypothetical protein